MMIWLRALMGGNGLLIAAAAAILAMWSYHKLTVSSAYRAGGSQTAMQYERQINATREEASARANEALAEAAQTAPAPDAPAELLRLCTAEPAGCRTRNPG